MPDRSAASPAPLMAVAVAMLSVQIGAAFAKGLFPAVGPEGVAALRVVLSALILGLVFRVWRLRPSRAQGLALIGYGAMMGLMNLLIYKAFAHIPIGIAVSVEVIGPLVVATLASRRRLDLAWIALAACGLALLPLAGQAGSSSGSSSGSLSMTGVLFALGAAACWGLYIVFGTRVSSLGAGPGVAAGMAVAALVVAPLGAVSAGAALLSSMIPYLLDMYAMGRLPRRLFGVLLSASPAVAALAGLAILHEALTPAQWTGIAAIVAACAGAAWSHRRGTPENPSTVAPV